MPDDLAYAIWSTADRERHFLIPNEADVPEGEFVLCTVVGRQKEVSEDAVLSYEVSEEEAKAWLKDQLGEVLGEAKNRLVDFAQKLREKTAEMRAENEAAWAEGDEETPAGPGRQAAERLGAFLQDLGAAIQKGAAERRAETEVTDERDASDEPTDEES